MALAFAVSLSLLLVVPSGAPAFTTVSAPFTAGTDVATGFPTCAVSPGFPAEAVGPYGLLDDGSYLYFTDQCNHHMYRLPENGGAVSAGLDGANGLDGVLVKIGGHYYGMAIFPGTQSEPGGPGLYEFDPGTLAVAGGGAAPVVSLATPSDLAIDPQTGDLFIGNAANGIVRVHGLPGSPVVTTFVAGSGSNLYAGLSFTSDGSILYATSRYNYPNIHVVGFDRTATQVFDVVDPNQGEGLAVAPPATTVNGVNVSNNVFVNDNGTNGMMPSTYGKITRIDVNDSNTETAIASGGTRGSAVVIDCHGFLLVTQTDRVERMTPAFFTKPPWCAATTTTTTSTTSSTTTTLVTTLPPSACPDAQVAAAIEAMVEAQCHCSTASNHGTFVRCAKHVAKATGSLPRSCKRAVADCAARSTCGKPGFVTCCRTTAKGKTTCSIKSDAARCKATKHGTACVGRRPSCCDACVSGGCAAP